MPLTMVFVDALTVGSNKALLAQNSAVLDVVDDAKRC
jgi:hypothetical protein